MKKNQALVGLLVLASWTTASVAQVPTLGQVSRFDFSGNATDSVSGLNASVFGATLTTDRAGNANSAYAFDGISNYLQVADSDAFSVSTTGEFTLSAWVAPTGTSLDPEGKLLFANQEGSGYVYAIGKGEPGQQEWALRFYSADNTETPNRDNRASFYLFNPAGGLGAGSYSQQPLVPGTWINYTTVVSSRAGTITLYKNGEFVDQDTFGPSLPPYHINPTNGTAPVRFGTRNGSSFFAGVLDDILIYDRVLSDAEVKQIYNAPAASSPSGQIPEPGTLALVTLGGALAFTVRRKRASR